MADLSINVNDAVSIGEDSDFYILLTVSDSDSITVGESIDLDVIRVISVSDSISIGESVDAHIAYAADVSDGITVSENATVEVPGVFYIDERWIPPWPVWSLDASFQKAFESWNLKHPGYSIEGLFGAILDEKVPVFDLDATLSVDTYVFTLDSMAPAFTGEGYFGASLDTKTPYYGIEAAFEEIYYATLDKSIPFWGIEGEIVPPLVFSLDSRIPVRIISVSMSPESISMSLDLSRVMYRIEADGYDETYMVLDRKIPVRIIDATMYSGDMWLDVTIPVWVMQAVGDGKIGLGTSVISDDTRFTDYILRYRRP